MWVRRQLYRREGKRPRPHDSQAGPMAKRRTAFVRGGSQFMARLIITDTPRSGPNCRRAEGKVRRLQATCYFTSARKLGVGSAPMSACLGTVAAAPGVPAATPRIGGTWRVT